MFYFKAIVSKHHNEVLDENLTPLEAELMQAQFEEVGGVPCRVITMEELELIRSRPKRSHNSSSYPGTFTVLKSLAANLNRVISR